MLFECQQPFHSDSISVVSPAQSVFLEMFEIGAKRAIYEIVGDQVGGFLTGLLTLC